MSNPEKTRTLNEKITDLNEKIAWFYSDDFSLDQAEANYGSTIKLAKEIEKDLNSLKNHIEIISHDFTS